MRWAMMAVSLCSSWCRLHETEPPLVAIGCRQLTGSRRGASAVRLSLRWAMIRVFRYPSSHRSLTPTTRPWMRSARLRLTLIKPTRSSTGAGRRTPSFRRRVTSERAASWMKFIAEERLRHRRNGSDSCVRAARSRRLLRAGHGDRPVAHGDRGRVAPVVWRRLLHRSRVRHALAIEREGRVDHGAGRR